MDKINIGDYTFMHATTLYSDGALALKINKIWGIPYVVGVRGSDVNSFSKYRPDLHTVAKEVLKNASKIIFISCSIESKFYNLSYVKPIKEILAKKSLTISNGIDDFWFKNIRARKTLLPSRILYIGNFTANKNVKRLISAFLHLQKVNGALRLDLVGKGGADAKKITELASQYSDIIKYHGPIYDKEELKIVYQNAHIFAMTSISETFGLVYLEAMSQGLPIVCSQNEGVDHTFEHKVGEFVNPKSVDSIEKGLRKILHNYEIYLNEEIDFSNYDWERIADRYYGLYNEILGANLNKRKANQNLNLINKV
ncbi:glycosyltransferase [Maribacter algicola]|uniref:Glycosyltransferase n=1 Tax=Meishania litoralis TaxID=3434685 RepID=A0ACC7LTR3_9FLAO